MKLSKKIVGLSLAVAMTISGFNAVPERVRAESVSADEQKVEKLDTKNVIAWRSSDKAVKMPEIAVDGSRIIDYGSMAASDGKYIYYVTDGFGYSIYKRNIKTGKETKIGRHLYTTIKLYKDFLLCDTYFVAPVGVGIIRLSKNGKSKDLFKNSGNPIGIGKYIYCSASILDENFNTIEEGIYRMDINGRNRKLVKKGHLGLGVSGNKLYYPGDYDEVKKELSWFDLNTNKLVKKTISSDRYDPISKTKFIFNDTTVKAGKYKNGKWQYKTILKHKMEKDSYIGIDDIAVCGNKLLVKIYGKDGNVKLYMTDLNGKNKKLLRKGIAFG